MARLSMSLVIAGTLVLGLGGCVTSVPGYDGPAVAVAVENNTATMEFTFPSGSWEATIDRSQVENNVAKVWVTAKRGGPFDTQQVIRKTVVFKSPDKTFTCCEVFVKASGSSHADDHVPAAEGCE
ncbi:MAG: hypothetical protein VX527_02295 [Planctomycetota bacterium]|nr:hypothetical protein [Planctomycetota bacterium]